MSSHLAARARTPAGHVAQPEPPVHATKVTGGVPKVTARRLILFIIAALAVAFVCGNAVLAVRWWWQARRAHENAWPEDVVNDDSLGRADDEEDAEDDADTAATVDAILASRGDVIKLRKPLDDVPTPPSNHCATLLPAGLATEDATGLLDELFKESSGFWASGVAELAAVSKAAGSGDPGPCAEGTYGEIQSDGIDAVLTALSAAVGRSGARSAGFEVLADLGAGVGRTAAAAVLLGRASKAFGVELGPQRFALGCQAFQQAAHRMEKPPWAALVKGATGHQAQLELLHGDARAWPVLATSQEWSGCGLGWAFYLGAECFRNSLLGDIAKAIAQGCKPGARLAVLGRRLPDAAKIYDEHDGGRAFLDLGVVHARTTWSASTEIFLYELA